MESLISSDPHFLEQRRSMVESRQGSGLEHVTVEPVAVEPAAVEPAAVELLADPQLSASAWRLGLYFFPQAPGQLEVGNFRILLDGVPEPRARLRSIDFDSQTSQRLTLNIDYEGPEPIATGHEDLPVHWVEVVGAPQVDRFFSRLPFVFKADSHVHRGVAETSAPSLSTPIDIDYQARDYESFRRLMLDRMAQLVPDWEERNPADLGVTIIEALAYAADYVSYRQDAIATEAYLNTAQSRISLRRHTRFIDYRLHEGNSARCWVQVKIEYKGEEEQEREPFMLPASTQLLTYTAVMPGAVAQESMEFQQAIRRGALTFETLHPVWLHPMNNRMTLHTWGVDDYTLPKGSLTAALVGHLPFLRRGDVLILQSRQDPSIHGFDPRLRQAIRLNTHPKLSYDPVTKEEITEIEWFEEDALRAPLVVAVLKDGHKLRNLTNVRGNIVLADEGRLILQDLGVVPRQEHFQPVLDIPVPPGIPQDLRLTHSIPFGNTRARQQAASHALRQTPWLTLPNITLYELEPWEPKLSEAQLRNPVQESKNLQRSTRSWNPRLDLLASGRFARDFVVEVDTDRTTYLRFGNQTLGRKPTPGSRMMAVYRIGRGAGGNVGPNSIRHIVLTPEVLDSSSEHGFSLIGAKNHLPATGGFQPESQERARRVAPSVVTSSVFTQWVLTEEDYVTVALRHAEVKAAVAEIRPTGSWRTAILYLQRHHDRPVSRPFIERLQDFFRPLLPLGRELEIRPPFEVPLDIQLLVRIQGDLPKELSPRHSERRHQDLLCPGKEFLDLSHLGFGEAVYASEIVARIMNIPSILKVEVKRFHRWGHPPANELREGRIEIGKLEIARLGYDPSRPQLGIIKVEVMP